MKSDMVEVDIGVGGGMGGWGNGGVMSYSTAVLELLGYGADEVEGLTVFDLVPEEGQHRPNQIYNPAPHPPIVRVVYGKEKK